MALGKQAKCSQNKFLNVELSKWDKWDLGCINVVSISNSNFVFSLHALHMNNGICRDYVTPWSSHNVLQKRSRSCQTSGNVF